MNEALFSLASCTILYPVHVYAKIFAMYITLSRTIHLDAFVVQQARVRRTRRSHCCMQAKSKSNRRFFLHSLEHSHHQLFSGCNTSSFKIQPLWFLLPFSFSLSFTFLSLSFTFLSLFHVPVAPNLEVIVANRRLYAFLPTLPEIDHAGMRIQPRDTSPSSTCSFSITWARDWISS